MTTTTTYTIPKLIKQNDGESYVGLTTTAFTLPFPYFQASDVVVSLRGSEDILLVEDKHYSITGSILTIEDTELGLALDTNLEVILSATRNTILDLAVFYAGHPVKAGDLNFNFQQLLYRIEENTTLINSNAWVGDVAPIPPRKGQTWLRTPYYTHYIYDGTYWVQPT